MKQCVLSCIHTAVSIWFIISTEERFANRVRQDTFPPNDTIKVTSNATFADCLRDAQDGGQSVENDCFQRQKSNPMFNENLRLLYEFVTCMYNGWIISMYYQKNLNRMYKQGNSINKYKGLLETITAILKTITTILTDFWWQCLLDFAFIYSLKEWIQTQLILEYLKRNVSV